MATLNRATKQTTRHLPPPSIKFILTLCQIQSLRPLQLKFASRFSQPDLMVATYSPHSDAGGTLHFPSPTTIRHVDAALAFKQLRRSLSRSPSKGPICRLIPSKSESPSPSSPLSPSRASLQTRAASTGLVPSPNVAQSSPLAPSHSSSVRKTLSSARKLSPMRVALRSRSSQRSPGKPKLSDSSDNGNAMPRSSVPSSDDIENRVGQETGLTEANMECLFKASATEVRENMAPYRALSKFEKSNGSLGTAKSSPLKRSDGIMNLDQKNLGSPSAKRRSIYGSAFGPDFDIFDHEDGLQSHNDARTTKDGLPVEFPGFPEYSNAASPLPRRTSTLRRTTLQQRHDKSTVSRSKLNSDLGLESTIPGQASSKAKLRMSLDGCQPSSINRDSPFSSLGSLPNASVHPIFQPSSKAAATHNQAQPQRHPLSRTITQSSSNSSMADDSPTHIPFRQPDHRKAIVDFSKSLPVGAARPGSSGAASSNLSSQVPSTEASFSTPENYRLAKPLPAAFMSTGLISKRHKDMEDSQPGFQGGRSQMPDTPCKRHSLLGASPIAPDNAIGKTRQARHSFGTPSTPFSPHPARQAPGTFGKGVSIFGSNFNGISMNRRDSFGSIHGDDNTTSPTTKHHSQSSNECDLPPTPTKQALVSSFLSAPGALEQRGVYEDLGITIGVGTRSGRLNQACKSISHLLEKPSGSVDGDSDNTVDKSPSVGLRFRSSFSVPSSFTGSRFMRRFTPPSPLLNISYNHSSTQSTRPETKSSLISPASPVSQRLEPLSPRTPREGMIPPDPSGLSISAHGNGQSFRPLGDSINGRRNPPPATPTASRENFSSFGNGRPSLNSSFNTSFAEIDSSLKSKFDKVELIGEGQFSLVYRVARTQEPKATRGYFTLPPNVESPKTPMPDKVWAVKRSRNPFIGPRDRLRKYQEVRTLRALGQNDHIVQFIDSWEDKNQLYIQTEFCEEGSLDRFLHEAGRRARLDDFRIWKILLELSLVSGASTSLGSDNVLMVV